MGHGPTALPRAWAAFSRYIRFPGQHFSREKWAGSGQFPAGALLASHWLLRRQASSRTFSTWGLDLILTRLCAGPRQAGDAGTWLGNFSGPDRPREMFISSATGHQS